MESLFDHNYFRGSCGDKLQRRACSSNRYLLLGCKPQAMGCIDRAWGSLERAGVSGIRKVARRTRRLIQRRATSQFEFSLSFPPWMAYIALQIIPMESDPYILKRRDYKFCTLWSASISSAVVVTVGVSVVMNPSVKNDPGIFAVAAPFIFLAAFIPSFVTLMIGRSIWNNSKRRPFSDSDKPQTDREIGTDKM